MGHKQRQKRNKHRKLPVRIPIPRPGGPMGGKGYSRKKKHKKGGTEDAD